ncbi:hypothetical protein BDN70DRAFT_890656 [Pholiota conissans]|uniref:Uncharacterized protein n=1 Tax=Pholiota conissans TaxID=109636 RepID=A0A9P5ZCU6_9AGAR|nr:hypothetical protein BDN70DRAFT_890656 [Pholiota conissans]
MPPPLSLRDLVPSDGRGAWAGGGVIEGGAKYAGLKIADGLYEASRRMGYPLAAKVVTDPVSVTVLEDFLADDSDFVDVALEVDVGGLVDVAGVEGVLKSPLEPSLLPFSPPITPPTTAPTMTSTTRTLRAIPRLVYQNGCSEEVTLSFAGGRNSPASRPERVNLGLKSAFRAVIGL